MKKLIAFFTLLFATVIIINCSTSEKENMNTTDETTTTKETKVERPRYEFTITQKGKELGKIIVELFPEVAPKHCKNFEELVTSGFYDGTAFHRVIPGFMIQGGDPNSKNGPKATWGYGAPDQKTVPAEFSSITHKRGILSTARNGNDVNSATSQFFIVVTDSPFLDNQYTVFGQVVEGMDVADLIVNSPTENPNRPIDKIEMKVRKLD